MITFIFILSACQSNGKYDEPDYVLDYKTCKEIINDKDKTHPIWSTEVGFTGVSKHVCDQVIYDVEFLSQFEDEELREAGYNVKEAEE